LTKRVARSLDEGDELRRWIGRAFNDPVKVLRER
jgi:hypothetical protein